MPRYKQTHREHTKDDDSTWLGIVDREALFDAHFLQAHLENLINYKECILAVEEQEILQQTQGEDINVFEYMNWLPDKYVK
jgi:hypothetical protein